MLKIKQLRQEKNISQHELARRINASPKTVNFWELGVSEPSAGFIVALADEFECSADYILGREDDFGMVTVTRGISASETELLKRYADLSDKDKYAVRAFIEFLQSGKSSSY
ncbi:MAG: helix-turn-helix transcriptional regulator [Clostridia bacterium]|nr:helix-turn-helix transcriptional regulator [Clostridia bacterium]